MRDNRTTAEQSPCGCGLYVRQKRVNHPGRADFLWVWPVFEANSTRQAESLWVWPVCETEKG